MIIEESDIESLTLKLLYKTLIEFKPDFLFSVSHARPSFAVPKELPVIGFIQDRCGPILELRDLKQHISSQDLFLCMTGQFKNYLISKSVPADQTFVMPVPADENLFYPLPKDQKFDQRFYVDVGFVKHADSCGGKVFEEFLSVQIQRIKQQELRVSLENIFGELYKKTCCVKDRRFYEPEIVNFVKSFFASGTDDLRHFLDQLAVTFYVTVYGHVWRYQFVEALSDAGIEIGLYGNHWQKQAKFSKGSRGPVDHSTELNKVYNFNKINLNIHPMTTMHQRISECGLAGGFMINADHPEDKDWEPIRKYFEPDKEMVMFDTTKDLVEKCKFYLAHPKAREEIAFKFRQKALAQQTTLSAARRTIDQWREVVRRTL